MKKYTFKNRELSWLDFNERDIAIIFSTPSSAVENIKKCLMNEIPVVCGTTGWLDNYEEIKLLCEKSNGTFLFSPNFSIGVNLFFKLNIEKFEESVLYRRIQQLK